MSRTARKVIEAAIATVKYDQIHIEKKNRSGLKASTEIPHLGIHFSRQHGFVDFIHSSK